MTSILCSVCAMQNLLLLLNSTWIYAYMMTLYVDTMLITDKKSLHFKLSKSSQIFHVNKTSFPRLSHICKFMTGKIMAMYIYDMGLSISGEDLILLLLLV